MLFSNFGFFLVSNSKQILSEKIFFKKLTKMEDVQTSRDEKADVTVLNE